MADIGTLEYTITAKDETSNTIDAIARKIQEMSNGLNEAGQLTDEQMARMSKDIQEAYAGLDQASATHRASLDSLQQTYDSLGTAMGEAFREGTQQGDAAYRMANQQRNAVAAQIREEKKLGKEIDKVADELRSVEDAYNKKADAVKKTTSAEASMRKQMALVVQEMAKQEEAARASGGEAAVQALRASEGFRQLQQEAGRLSNAIGDAKKQMAVFANDNAGLQGVIVGLQGMTGAMAAAQGIAGMFTSDQEKLQQVMLKVQSVIAIANGMMQVSNALNKDSYFTLVILNRVKEAWASTSKEALAAQQAETAGTVENTVAEGANTVATELNTAAENAGTVAKAKGLKGWIANRLAAATDTKAKIANTIATKAASVASVGLAGALRLVSVAIKSIPVIGWILAGIAGLASLIGLLGRSSREAKKEQEELNNKIKDSAAEPVASITKLSSQYKALGDNMQEKEKFIARNKAEFEKLGIAINSVNDAEEVLIKNKEKFIQAQIEKAKANVYYEQAKEKAKDLVEAEQDYAKKNSNKNQEAVQEAEDALEEIYDNAAQAEQKSEQLMGRFAAANGAAGSEVSKKTADTAADSIASINRLSAQWKALGGDIKKQNKFIAENKGEFDKLGLGIKNAADAENALVTNKDKFVAAMMAKAESMAYFDLAKEKFKDYIQASLDYDALMETVTMAGGASEEVNQRLVSLQAKMRSASAEAESLITKGNKKAEQAARLNTPTTTKTTKEDPFIKQLNERKKEYERYTKFITSKNETLQAAAQGEEFKKLLEGGATYRQYLENQIAQLEQAGEKTAGYRAHITALRDELAALQQESVIDDFKKALEEQLAAAKTQQEMLDIIAKQRKELEGSEDNEVTQQKTKILDQQETDIAKKDQEQTQQLLQQYSDYLQKKLAFEESYADNSRRLKKAIEEAKTEDERRIAENALMQLERQRERYASNRVTGDTDYDEMLAEFRNFEEKKAAIEQEYDEKIAIAREHNDEEMVKRLEKQKKAEVSRLAVEKLQGDEAWKNLFDNLDNLSYEAVQRLIKQIESETLEIKADISEEDLEEIKKKLREAADQISAKNPFTALKNAIDKFSDESSSANLQSLLGAGSSLAENFKSITDSMRQIAELTGNQELADAADLMDDIIGNFQAAEEGAEAWGGWWGAIIGGLTDLIPKVIKWINKENEDVKAINDTIEENEKKMEEYGEIHAKLQKEVSKATGQALDETNRKLGENIRLQITQLETTIATMEQQMADTKDSKITDDMRQDLAEYKQQVNDLKDELGELMDDIVERTLGNKTVNSLMEDLASALVDAWAKGENAAEAYRNKVKDIVKDIARNMIIQSLVTDALTGMLTQYTDRWTENTSWEDKMNDISAWYQQAMDYSDEMMEAFNGINDQWKEWLSMDTEASGLSGAIKGMSQESADLLAGVANAMRLNQATMISIMTDIFDQTTGINRNTANMNTTLGNIYNELHGYTSSTARADRALGILDQRATN